MDREAWQATVHGVAKEMDTTQQLSNSSNKCIHIVLGLLWKKVSCYQTLLIVNILTQSHHHIVCLKAIIVHFLNE